jgi:hypothetical protein
MKLLEVSPRKDGGKKKNLDPLKRRFHRHPECGKRIEEQFVKMNSSTYVFQFLLEKGKEKLIHSCPFKKMMRIEIQE